MTCLNPIHLPPLAPHQCPNLMGSLLQHAHVNPGVPTQRPPQLKFITREEALARKMFSDPKPEHPLESTQPELDTRPTGAADKATSPGILDHLWLAAGRFFESMQPAPSAVVPVHVQEASPANNEKPITEPSLSPERLARRKAIALLKEKGGLNAQQARKLFDAYLAAGIPINEHTVSPYHFTNQVGKLERLTHAGISKTNYVIEGKTVTRVIKSQPCHSDPAPGSERLPLGLDRPWEGGRTCELNALAASAVNQAMGLKLVPRSWLGSYLEKDGSLRLALISEYIEAVQLDGRAFKTDPDLKEQWSDMEMFTSLCGESDSADPLVSAQQVDGKTRYTLHFVDFDLAFGDSVELALDGFPMNSFHSPDELTRRTRDKFIAIQKPGRLRALLAPLLSEPALVAQEKRARALTAFCKRLADEGKVR